MTIETDAVSEVTTSGRPARAGHDDGLRVEYRIETATWDRFVAAAPGGHYTQSSAWARFRSAFGWKAERVAVTACGELVAGAQVLVRPVGRLGAIGYVHRGPVTAATSPEALAAAMHGVEQLCRRHKIRYLALRPSLSDVEMEQQLTRRGLRFSPMLQSDVPLSTARVALDPSPDEILARMRRSTRGNIRRGLSRGLAVRLGTGEDLPILLKLLRVAADRRGGGHPSTARYERLWSELDASGLTQLFIVEHEGEPVSAQLLIRFGDTTYSHLMAWSGEHANRKPNELLEWTAMLWARDHGCRFYDFEGVGDPARDGATVGRRGSGSERGSTAAPDDWVSDYKLGFGAEVVPMPGFYEWVANPLLRWGYHRALPVVAGLPGAGGLESRLRRAVSGRAR